MNNPGEALWGDSLTRSIPGGVLPTLDISAALIGKQKKIRLGGALAGTGACNRDPNRRGMMRTGRGSAEKSRKSSIWTTHGGGVETT